MDVSTWALALIANLLGQTKLPTFIVAFIMAQLKTELTPENVHALKVEIECFICKHLHDCAGDNHSEAVAAVLKGVEELLGCKQCTPQTAPAAVAIAHAAA